MANDYCRCSAMHGVYKYTEIMQEDMLTCPQWKDSNIESIITGEYFSGFMPFFIRETAVEEFLWKQ